MTTLRLPVSIIIGVGRTRDLTTVRDLLEFLDEWPGARTGPVRQKVRQTCLEALDRRKTPEEARAAFVAFARLLGVLDEVQDNAVPPTAAIDPPLAARPAAR